MTDTKRAANSSGQGRALPYPKHAHAPLAALPFAGVANRLLQDGISYSDVPFPHAGNIDADSYLCRKNI
ncbi:hypothetical protein E2C01_016617 [Portunus trituberculatus]|uniref:Uncharacterized protein n=1 Tax=Portunus trituberculatus TaxID=210409 RepID=A0A5B7DPI0_PORTR|nr:hypothetical protein [Portunus trituberculatus]